MAVPALKAAGLPPCLPLTYQPSNARLPRSVMNVIKVLAKVEEANQLGRQLPPEAFYNELIRWVGSVQEGAAEEGVDSVR